MEIATLEHHSNLLHLIGTTLVGALINYCIPVKSWNLVSTLPWCSDYQSRQIGLNYL